MNAVDGQPKNIIPLPTPLGGKGKMKNIIVIKKLLIRYLIN